MTSNEATIDTEVPIEERFVSINGRVISTFDAATISIFDTSFHRGDGVFEVMRIIPTSNGDAKIRCLDQQLRRLQTSADAVGCPLPPKDTLAQWLQDAATASGNRPGSLRLIATKGNHAYKVEPSVIISWSPIPPWPDTFTLYPVLAPWHPAGFPGWETPIKWTSYGPNVVSSNKAKAAGFTDALLLSPHWVERPVPPQTWNDVDIRKFHILDGPNFALAFVEEANDDVGGSQPILYLPCNERLGLLPSITQSRLARVAEDTLGMAVKREMYTLGQMLDVADEVFVMSTTRGVRAVTKIGDHDIPCKSTSSGKERKSLWVAKFSKLLESE
ncbi:aminotransferase [Nitzschia inconspicua]|uniref:Aminotransferase n=1 Tax=Nitzschia inconspicua TaxID=303405 RepID=A0A9K3PPA5_9STRA|nr:aminotransferase [Nitzschia inconspicua]